jgi:hypothetical protein
VDQLHLRFLSLVGRIGVELPDQPLEFVDLAVVDGVPPVVLPRPARLLGAASLSIRDRASPRHFRLSPAR